MITKIPESFNVGIKLNGVFALVLLIEYLVEELQFHVGNCVLTMKLPAAEEIQVFVKVVLITGRRVLDFHAFQLSVLGKLVQGIRQADVFQKWLF